MSKKFIVKFDTGNSAFDQDNYCSEVARILRAIAQYVENGSTIESPPRLTDYNGNTVGYFSGIGEER